MSIPTLDKTWQFDVNNVYPATGVVADELKIVLLAIKNKLKGFGTLPWTVVGSSDSVTAGIDATDRWTTTANIVFGGTPFSWIVLKQTGLLANFQILLSCNVSGSDERRLTSYLSPNAGFTGGSINARPTATDEAIMSTGTGNGIGSGYGGGATYNRIVNVLQSTDGQCTRVIIYGSSGTPVALWMFDKLKNPVSGLTYPAVGCILSASTSSPSVPLYANLNEVNYVASSTPGGAALAMMTTEGRAYYDGGGFQHADPLGTWWTSPGDLNGKWPIFPVAIHNYDGGGSKGRLGTLFDFYGGSASVASGNSYPANGTFLAAQVGHFIHPWNGTVPRIT